MLIVLALLVACHEPAGAPAPAPLGTGARLSVDHLGGTDVTGFRFEITRVGCDPADTFTPSTLLFGVDLLAGTVSSGISLLGTELDPGSQHHASDLFVSLPPGCWDVVATPAAAVDPADPADFTPSVDCSTATVDGVQIFAEQTTDVTLLSQCQGDPGDGSLDLLVVLNHPPTLSLALGGTSHAECEPFQVCATVTDPDDDAVELVVEAPTAWDLIAGPLELVGYEGGHRVWEQCFDLVHEDVGEHALALRAFDVLANGDRFDDLVAPLTSRAEWSVSLQTSFFEPAACTDGVGLVLLEDDVDRAPGCDPHTPDEWYCDPGDPLLCDNGSLVLSAAYPACAPGLEDGTSPFDAAPDCAAVLANHPDPVNGDYWIGPPSAATLEPCFFDLHTLTFGSPGTHPVTLPSEVRYVHVELWGAGGASSSNGWNHGYGGGAGAWVDATLDIQGLTDLQVVVGEWGSANYSGAFQAPMGPGKGCGGPGAPGSAGHWGPAGAGGGGGFSSLFHTSLTQANLLAIAGGGGGAGVGFWGSESVHGGGGGADTGLSGGHHPGGGANFAGLGGTQVAGGGNSPASGGVFVANHTTTTLQGGPLCGASGSWAGSASSYSDGGYAVGRGGGGGGGGGWYGGGGGGTWSSSGEGGGGGGGSSRVDATRALSSTRLAATPTQDCAPYNACTPGAPAVSGPGGAGALGNAGAVVIRY